MRHARSVMIAAAIAPLLGGCMPPLLRGAQAGPADWPTCLNTGPILDTDFPPGPLDQRLLARHPNGSNASALTNDLRRQGFKLQGPCPTAPSVSWATNRSGFGLANVFWKTDPAGNLVWSKGYVAWDGL